MIITLLCLVWMLAIAGFGTAWAKEELGWNPRIPQLSMPKRKPLEEYEVFEARIDAEIAAKISADALVFKDARYLMHKSAVRLKNSWDTQFIREALLKEIWESRKGEWAKRATEFKEAQKDIRNLPVYWVLGNRSYDANRLIDVLKEKKDDWHLSLYLENCKTAIRDEELSVQKQLYARYIKDDELVSFVTNTFDYSKLSKYEPYYGTEKTQLDKYFELQAGNLLEFNIDKPRKNSNPEHTEIKEALIKGGVTSNDYEVLDKYAKELVKDPLSVVHTHGAQNRDNAREFTKPIIHGKEYNMFYADYNTKKAEVDQLREKYLKLQGELTEMQRQIKILEGERKSVVSNY